MGEKYLVTKAFGTFVLNEHLFPIGKIIFQSPAEKNQLLEKGEWLDEEKKLIKEYKKLIFLGHKKLNKDIEFSSDPAKLQKASEFVLKNYRKELWESSITVAKQKVKGSVSNDILIIQTINNIGELESVANTLIKRLREWYELYNPEFSHSITNQEKFVQLILEKPKDVLLKEIRQNVSMGADLPIKDLEPIMALAKEADSFYKLIEHQKKYLDNIMRETCPNMVSLTGPAIGANLISIAGSLKHLVEFPASTIQLLGAEKALFRHLTTNAKSPKYGILHEHPLVQKSKNKGKAARMLAAKISLAVKVDYFKGEFIGEKLRKELEQKII